MLIVADTGPLITLIQLGQLHLTEKLFPDFVIPEEVFQELNRYQPLKEFSVQLNSLKSRLKKPKQLIQKVEALDVGELACISLYFELHADAILIEDKAARDWAESNGINCLGSIAVLIKAKRAGLIQSIKPLLLEMRAHKRYLSNELLVKTLKDEGED
jgi:predicted nucleic acid-binding protein